MQSTHYTDFMEQAAHELEAGPAILQGAGLALLGLALSTLVYRSARRLPPATFRPVVTLPVVLLSLLTMMAATALLPRGPADLSDEERVLPALLVTVAAEAAAVVMALALVQRQGGRARDLGFRAPFPGQQAKLAAVSYLASGPLLLGVILIEAGVRKWLDLELPRQSTVESIATSPALQRNWLLLGLVIVAVPLLEEALFRGLALSFLLAHARPAFAVPLGALLFALPHDAGRIPVFLLGLIMGWLYYRTGSLLAPWLFHALHNGVTILAIITTGGPAQ